MQEYKHTLNKGLATGLSRLARAGGRANLNTLDLTRNEWDNFQKLRPKVRLRTSDGHPVVLHLAGPRAKAPGSVVVSDGRYGGEWYGRILEDGTWQEPRAGVPADVALLVRALARDPGGTAAGYGRVTGSCCFCGRGLTDAPSVDAGYGPVCADHYGLPWG